MRPGVGSARLDLGTQERFQRLRAELGVESFGLNLMRLAPGQRGRIHRHERQEEVYVVLEGTLTVEVDGGERHELGRGDLLRVAPEVRRQLSAGGPEAALFLAIGGSHPHEGRDGVAYESWEATEGRPPQDVPLPGDA